MALSGFTHAVNYRKLIRATTSDVWTVAVWCYPTTSAVAYMTPMETQDSGLVGVFRSGGGTVWTADYPGLAANYNRNTGIAVDVNTWQLVVATINATTGTHAFVLYKGSGGSITSDSWSTASGVTSKTLTNWFQYQPGQAGRYFQGRIALAAVWSTVLSSTDVTALYNGGAGVDPATIQASFIRISNYFDDQELSIDGATDGASTYTDFGTLTTVAGPFTAPTVPFTGVGEIGDGEAEGLAGSAAIGGTWAGSLGDGEAVGLAGSAAIGGSWAGSLGESEASGLAGSIAVGGTWTGSQGIGEAAGLQGSAAIGCTWAGSLGSSEAQGLAGSSAVGGTWTGSAGDAEGTGLAGTVYTGFAGFIGIGLLGEGQAEGLTCSAAVGGNWLGAIASSEAVGLAGSVAVGGTWSGPVGEAEAQGFIGTFGSTFDFLIGYIKMGLTKIPQEIGSGPGIATGDTTVVTPQHARHYVEGGSVYVWTKFYTVDKVLRDPDPVVLYVSLEEADGTKTLLHEWQYGVDAEIERVSQGFYRANVGSLAPGTYHYSWTTPQAPMLEVEDTFYIHERRGVVQ